MSQPENREQGSALMEFLAAVPWGAVVVLLVGLGVAGWYFLAPESKPQEAGGENAAPAGPPAMTAVQSQGLAAGMGSDTLLREARIVLTNIVDAESAKKTAPKIEDLTTRFNALRAQIQELPDENQRILMRDVVAKGGDSLLIQVDQVLKVPGVGEVLSESFAKLREAVEAFSN
ncbi:MAG: hypothetical protein ACT4QC_02680 [Planctomycetaceae bacterium]